MTLKTKVTCDRCSAAVADGSGWILDAYPPLGGDRRPCRKDLCEDCVVTVLGTSLTTVRRPPSLKSLPIPMPEQEIQVVLSASQAARVLGCSRQYLCRLAQRGDVAYRWTPLGRLFLRADIEALAEQRRYTRLVTSGG